VHHSSVQEDHPTRRFWDQQAGFDRYPEGVEGIKEPIPGLAFFPGGYGLIGCREGSPLPAFPTGGVLVVGHNFDSVAGYRKSLDNRTESDKSPTWSNLRKLLETAGVPEARCFFTNLYIGLIVGATNRGKFPGSADPEFVKYCQSLLLSQIRELKPRLILTLGLEVPPVLGALSPELTNWQKARTIKALDAAGAVQRSVTFEGIAGFATTVVALLHPSERALNVRLRSYDKREHLDAEVAMLVDAWNLHPTSM
jgi:hypothetical protein